LNRPLGRLLKCLGGVIEEIILVITLRNQPGGIVLGKGRVMQLGSELGYRSEYWRFIRPAAEFFGVVENLAHDLAPRFRIAPELAFDEHRQAGRRDHEIVDRAGGRIQFRANRHRV